MLDWVTAVAKTNSLPHSRIDCITSRPAAGAGYTAALLEPVQLCGRLDQGVLLGLAQVLAS